MVKKKIIMRLFLVIVFIFYSTSIFAEVDTDQWQDSNFTYKDLIDQGLLKE